MTKYRKKPVVIEAYQLTADTMVHIVRWMDGKCKWIEDQIALIIPTLEGNMQANNGDYIIKGINGEFYPCREDIFLKTYEKVEE